MNNSCINLIRERVPSSGRRKRQFLVRIAYLGLCGVLAAVECYLLTARCIHRMGLKNQIELLEDGFKSRHEDVRDHVEYAGKLCDELRSQSREMAILSGWMDKRVNLPAILVGLLTPVPAPAELGEMYTDPKYKRLHWSIVEPEEDGPGIRPVDLAAKWKSDQSVALHLENIETVLTERRRVKGQSMIMHRFQGDLRSGEDG